MVLIPNPRPQSLLLEGGKLTTEGLVEKKKEQVGTVVLELYNEEASAIRSITH